VTSSRRLVFLVEDDPEVAQLITSTLEPYNFHVEHLTRGAELLARVKRSPPAACIIDLGLPDVDGLQLVRSLQDSGIALLVVTGRGNVADRIVGLELGADDYLVKPFEPRELVARLNSVLRRLSKAPDSNAVATFAGWRFDVDALALTAPGGQQVRLSHAEAQLLELFVRSPNRVLTRDHLLAACGTAEQAFDRSIDVRISRLRQKLEDDPQAPRFIRTVYGSGYLFAVPVEWSQTGRSAE
jgi:two-component system, OmpR family, response regulator